MSRVPKGKQIDLSFTSPSTAGTSVVVAETSIAGFASALIYAHLLGATGGTLDIYLQVSPDGGTTWVDYAHFPQLLAGASAVDKVWAVSKLGQQTTLQTVGTGLSPALAANTIVGGEFGDRIRVVAVAGVGTSSGALQTIKMLLSGAAG